MVPDDLAEYFGVHEDLLVNAAFQVSKVGAVLLTKMFSADSEGEADLRAVDGGSGGRVHWGRMLREAWRRGPRLMREATRETRGYLPVGLAARLMPPLRGGSGL